jgi:hypothetical protein
MTERPVLFNDAMVRAILDGSKTQTRRPIKASRGRELCMLTDHEGRLYTDDAGRPRVDECWCREPEIVYDVRRPAEVGDVLWVRETHMIGRDHAPDSYPQIVYRADGAIHDHDGRAVCPTPSGHATIKDGGWTPSIHMPRWASRLTLKVTEVRVERVQDITERDARAEGVETAPFTKAGRHAGYLHVEAFEDLWNEVYGTWDANPWVWAISFEVVP